MTTVMKNANQSVPQQQTSLEPPQKSSSPVRPMASLHSTPYQAEEKMREMVKRRELIEAAQAELQMEKEQLDAEVEGQLVKQQGLNETRPKTTVHAKSAFDRLGTHTRISPCCLTKTHPPS